MRALIDPADEPQAAFRQAQLRHIFFGATIPLLLISTTLLHGYHEAVVQSDPAEWAFRGGLGIFVIYGLVLGVTLNEARIIKRTMRLRPQELDKAIMGSLGAVQAMRTIQSLGPAAFGAITFFLTGNLLDSYVPAALSVMMLLLWRPARSHWEAVFRRAAAGYPGVSASPW